MYGSCQRKESSGMKKDRPATLTLDDVYTFYENQGYTTPRVREAYEELKKDLCDQCDHQEICKYKDKLQDVVRTFEPVKRYLVDTEFCDCLLDTPFGIRLDCKSFKKVEK